MLKLTVKNSYINEILHEINDFKVQRTFVDCKLVCQGGVVQCHAAMLQYANIWWVNCRNSDIDECVIISYLSARQCLLNLETLGNVGRDGCTGTGNIEIGQAIGVRRRLRDAVWRLALGLIEVVVVVLVLKVGGCQTYQHSPLLHRGQDEVLAFCPQSKPPCWSSELPGRSSASRVSH